MSNFDTLILVIVAGVIVLVALGAGVFLVRYRRSASPSPGNKVRFRPSERGRTATPDQARRRPGRRSR